MKTIAIIAAHMGSSRLPGKVLMDLAGQTVLERVIRRVQRCKEVDDIVVATTLLPADCVIEKACEQMAVPVFRGSDTDVLDRFTRAALLHSADVCVRITSDCPLIDPEVSDHIIRRFKEADPPVDYASNKIPQSYPRGLDTEVFTIEALERTWREATERYQRSHVTIYMYEHPGQFKLLSITDDTDRSEWRWTVDTAEDLQLVREIYNGLGRDGTFGWRDIISFLSGMPALRYVNRHIVQKPVQQG